MNKQQHSGQARQERIALASIPRLNVLANVLMALVEDIFSKQVTYSPENGADVMVLSFVTKQHEHLRSVTTLIAAGSHRDAQLIARTMLEGLSILLWAIRNRPERTDLWFWYGAILDWRQIMEIERGGLQVDAQEKAELRQYVDEHGPKYLRDKVKKAMEEATASGSAYKLPEDPWRTNWTTSSIEAMFTEVGGQPLYDRVYRKSSEWVHWGPRTILRAMEPAQWGTAGFTAHDWPAAARAIQGGCQALLQSMEVLNEHFGLGISERLGELDDSMSTILSESIEAGSRADD